VSKSLRQRFGPPHQPATPFYVALAGNIGVGKSMLTRLIGQTLGWRMHFEPVINNPYLDDFYADMRRWSFHLQVYFLSQRFTVHKAILDDQGSAVQDRTIYEDVEIFAPTLHRRGCMDQRDYENYREVFASMTAFLRPPDLILYLWCRPETALSRIRERGRSCEKEIPLDYLADLHAAYEDWIERAPALCAVEHVNTEELDLRSDPEAQARLLTLIADHHREKAAALGGTT
jgi:deoxyadenosine/deoxycytidine kinase